MKACETETGRAPDTQKEEYKDKQELHVDRLLLIRVCDGEDNGVMTVVAGIQMNQSQHAVNQSTDALLTERHTPRTTLTHLTALTKMCFSYQMPFN